MNSEFPFTADEWDSVHVAGDELVQASCMGDELLIAIKRDAVIDVIAELREKYDDHPVLLETEADFTDDIERRLNLYEQALAGAIAMNIPTYTIRISMAGVLLGLGSKERASRLLHDGASEMQSVGDDYEQTQWRDLLRRCE